MPADLVFVAAVRAALAAVGDPVRAPQMQAYMRSGMPYLGVHKPVRTAALAALLRSYAPTDRATYEATVRALWYDASYREQRYAATDLTGTPAARGWQDTDSLRLYGELVVDGAWWDHVDEIATHRVGPVLLADPSGATPVLRRWAHHKDLWLRRTAIICQLGARHRTNTALLDEAIEASIDDPDFFSRKAIGWALRQHARTDPSWVRAYLAAHRERLSSLSYREASRWL